MILRQVQCSIRNRTVRHQDSSNAGYEAILQHEITIEISAECDDEIEGTSILTNCFILSVIKSHKLQFLAIKTWRQRL